MSMIDVGLRVLAYGVGAVAGLLSIEPASAWCLAVHPETFTTQRIYLNFGEIVVPSSLPIGATIITRSYPVTQKDDLFFCGTTGQVGISRLSYSSPWFNRFVPGMDSVIATDVPGVGIRMRQSIMNEFMSVVSVYYPVVYSHQVGRYLGVPRGDLVVELIKTASVVGSGKIFPSDYFFASYQVTLTPSADPVLAVHMEEGSGIIKSGTCAPAAGSKNIAVTFGSVSRSAFTGMGAVAANRDFDIELDCQGFDPVGTVVGVRVDAPQVASNLPGVMPLTASADTASGVAIEIVQRGVQGERPLRFGESVVLSGAAWSAGKLVLRLRARYIQTSAAKVTSGKANGLATFTIQYN